MEISRRMFWLVLSVLGSLGMAGNPLPVAEQAVALIRSAQTGAWSAVATWEGCQVPGAGARVQIREGHTVMYDVKSEQPIRLIHIAGTLTVARDKDTRLDVGLIKIQAGDDASEDGFDCEAHLPDAPASGHDLLAATASDRQRLCGLDSGL